MAPARVTWGRGFPVGFQLCHIIISPLKHISNMYLEDKDKNEDEDEEKEEEQEKVN